VFPIGGPPTAPIPTYLVFTRPGKGNLDTRFLLGGEEVVVVEEVISKWWVGDGDLGRPESRRV
jgi:hypothetical protein